MGGGLWHHENTVILLANWIVGLLGLYLAAGILFGIPFVLRGVQRIDPVARHGTRGFRAVILPGVIALWPILLRRWVSGTEPSTERNAHRDAASERR